MSNERKKNFVARHQIVDAHLKKAAYKQAYLMGYMDALVQPLQENTNPSRFVKLLKTENHSDAVINRLTISPEVMTFFEGRPIDYSQLVPHIEIYKVFIHGGKDVSEVLFPFSSYTDFKSDWTTKNMLSSPFRGRDAGIKSVKMEMEGKGRNTVSRWIQKVTMKFVFNDVKTLFKQWTGPSGQSVQYSDLFRYSPTPRTRANTVSPLNHEQLAAKGKVPFRIRLSIGWNVNPDNPIFKINTNSVEKAVSSLGSTGVGGGGSWSLAGGFVDAARNSKLNWIGELIKHEMEFKEDGSVEVTVMYYGALEHSFSTVRADILKNYNFGDGENIKILKEQLNEIELTFWKSAEQRATGANKQELTDMMQLKKAAAKLDAISSKINRIILEAKGDSPYVNILPRLDRNYNFFRETLAGNRSQYDFMKGVSELEQATKNIPYDQIIAHAVTNPIGATAAEEQTNVKMREIAPNALPKKDRKKYRNQLRIAKNAILSGINALEANMRAKHLFEYLERLMEEDKVAWISTTGKNKAFQSWLDYRQLLDEASAEATAEAKEWFNKRRDEWEEMTKQQRAAEYNGLNPEQKKAVVAAGLAPKPKKSKNPIFGLIDVKEVGAQIKQNMSKQKKTVTITTLNGDQVVINTFKKLGATSELFLSGKYVPGDKVMFFTLGDLISVMFDHGNFGYGIEQTLPDFRLILGNMNYQSVNASDTQSINLYFLPICLEVFINFIAQKVVGEGRDETGYPLLDFIQDLIRFIINKVVAPVGTDAASAALVGKDSDSGKRFRIELTPIVLPKKFVKSNIVDGVHTNAVLDLHSKNRSRYTSAQSLSINQMSNTLLLTAPRSRPFEERIKRVHRADPVLDKEEGIPHFMVGGPNRGLLKSVKFSESKNNKFAMAVYTAAEEGNLTSRRGMIKPSRFFVDLVLVGNPYFYVGQYIYVNTDLISGGHFSAELIMNGGYYIVTSVHNEIGVDKWETKIQGKLEIADVVIRHGLLSNPVTKLKNAPVKSTKNTPLEARIEAYASEKGVTIQEAVRVNLEYMKQL